MRLLIFTSILLISFLSSCDKTEKKAEYIVAVSGSDYTDDAYILCSINSDNLSTLNLSGGEAPVSGTKKCRFHFLYPSHTLNNFAPDHQTAGDVINIKIHKKKRNGDRGDQVGETSITCSNYDEYPTVVDIEW